MYMCVRRAGGGWGLQGEILPIWCALHHSLVCIMSGGPCDAAARRAGVKKKRRGEGSLHPLAPTESTSHSARAAGGKAREKERERESEREREESGERVRVCVRVSCVCAWIAPPHPVHRFCRRPCSDGENKTDNAFFSLRCPHRRVIPDVTDKSFYVASCFESCAVHLGETVTPWLWLWNL